MAQNPNVLSDVARALALAREGAWDDAHAIVQGLGSDPYASWLHGALHKIEGDMDNARYWYARCNREFEDFSDNAVELATLGEALEKAQGRG